MNSNTLEAMQFAHMFDKDAINTTGSARYTITYQFAKSSKPIDLPSNTNFTGWTKFTAAERAAINAQLNQIETVLNVDFVRVTGASDPDLNLGKVTIPGTTAGFGGNSISFFGTQITIWDGFAVFDNTLDLSLDTHTNLLLHEIAHAMGLKHPFAGTPKLPAAEENNKYTVMSYDDNPDNGEVADALMLYDVFALQDIWGAAENNTGNTVYNGPRNDTVDTIWDSGGVDKLSASGSATDVTLDLREGKFSTFGTYEDVVIAYGTRIENATGGAGNDTITGNKLANVLEGQMGDDTVSAGGGKDKVYGGLGNDTLSGRKGNDKIWGDAGGDDLFGDNGRDFLRGGKGRDDLDGGKGNDVLFGGGGKDTFHFALGGGQDVVKDFSDPLDKLMFTGLGTQAQVLAKAANVGSDVVFTFGGGDVLTVLDITLAQIGDNILV